MKRILLLFGFLGGFAMAVYAQIVTPPIVIYTPGTINNCQTTPPTLDAVGQAHLAMNPNSPVLAICQYAIISEEMLAGSLTLAALGVGPAGPQGMPGPAGPAGAAGPKGDTGPP